MPLLPHPERKTITGIKLKASPRRVRIETIFLNFRRGDRPRPCVTRLEDGFTLPDRPIGQLYRDINIGEIPGSSKIAAADSQLFSVAATRNDEAGLFARLAQRRSNLKVVEEYVGFERAQDEYGGSWAMAKFILATETDDETERNGLMAEILKYNEEDLAATSAVFDWLRSK